MAQCNRPSSLSARSRDTGQLLYSWLAWEQLLRQEGSHADPAAEGIPAGLSWAGRVSDVWCPLVGKESKALASSKLERPDSDKNSNNTGPIQ